MSGTPFVQSLVSQLHENPTYKLHLVWYCEFWFHQDRSIHMRIPFTSCPHLSGPHCIYRLGTLHFLSFPVHI